VARLCNRIGAPTKHFDTIAESVFHSRRCNFIGLGRLSGPSITKLISANASSMRGLALRAFRTCAASCARSTPVRMVFSKSVVLLTVPARTIDKIPPSSYRDYSAIRRGRERFAGWRFCVADRGTRRICRRFASSIEAHVICKRCYGLRRRRRVLCLNTTLVSNKVSCCLKRHPFKLPWIYAAYNCLRSGPGSPLALSRCVLFVACIAPVVSKR